MSDDPRIEFPYRYPIKIIVATGERSVAEAIERAPPLAKGFARRHQWPTQSRRKVCLAASQSVGRGEAHLKTLYQELLDHQAVRIIFNEATMANDLDKSACGSPRIWG